MHAAVEGPDWAQGYDDHSTSLILNTTHSLCSIRPSDSPFNCHFVLNPLYCCMYFPRAAIRAAYCRPTTCFRLHAPQISRISVLSRIIPALRKNSLVTMVESASKHPLIWVDCEVSVSSPKLASMAQSG